MDTDLYIAALESDGAALADAAGSAGLDAPVPSCPGWRVAELIRHTGYVHRWAMGNILDHRAEVSPGDTEEQIVGAGDPPEAELLAWFARGHRDLVETLKNADPDGAYPVFLRGSSSPLAFWARRQAHETAIHRADAQLAAGQRPRFARDFAADGVDELIMGFVARGRVRPPGADGRSMRVRATDTAVTWQVSWPAEPGARPVCERVDPGTGGVDSPGAAAASAAAASAAGARTAGARTAGAGADCQLAGPAAVLYPLLWNRADPDPVTVTITGDPGLLQAWRDGFHVRW
jgi:uncharacterized protein (TIGR03083 family)